MPTIFKDIRAAIKKLIDENSETVQAVYNYDRSTFEGFPAVIISPSENQSDYESNQHDKVTFVFKVRAFYPIPKESEHAAAETALEGVVDELLGLFRDHDCLGSACDWVEPTPSAWYYEERSEAVYRVAELTIKCRKYVAGSSC
jgi:hypothetical protein